MRTAICSTSDNTTYTFEMPAANVTVTAEFEFISNVTLTPATTYIDFDNDTAETDRRSSAELIAGQLKQSGTSLAKNGNATGAVFSIDASAYAGRIRTATLKYQAVSKDTNGTPLRVASFTNYVDISDTLINATNINSSGGALTTLPADGIWTNGSATGYAERTYDITSTMRSKNGQALMVIFASNAHENYIKDVTVELVVEPETIKSASATIHTVYADNEGSLTVGGNTYTEFGTATVVSELYQGDTYTPASTYSATVDDGTKTVRYEYVSGVSAVNLEKDIDTGTNDIYIIYNKIDYAVTPITVTVPTEVSEETEVTIHVAGTPTSAGATAVDQDVVVTIAGGETSGTNNTLKLLPGTYKYSFAQTNAYLAVAETSVTVGETNTVALTANSKQGTSATINYVTNLEDVENTTVKTITLDDVFAEDALNLESEENIATYLATQEIPNTTPANTYKRYTIDTYTAGTYKIDSLSATASENVINIKVSTDNVDYYYYNDYEDTSVTSTSWNSPNAGSTSFKTANGNRYVAVSGGGSGNRNSYFAFGENVTDVTSGKVKVSFKMMVTGNGGTKDRSNRQINIFEKGTTPTTNGLTSNSLWSAETPTFTDATAPASNILIYGNNANNKTLTYTANVWYTVDIYVDIDNKTVAYTIKNGNETLVTDSYTITDAEKSIAGIGGINVLWPRGGADHDIDDLSVSYLAAMPE